MCDDGGGGNLKPKGKGRSREMSSFRFAHRLRQIISALMINWLDWLDDMGGEQSFVGKNNSRRCRRRGAGALWLD